jgi:hypothetical protein
MIYRPLGHERVTLTWSQVERMVRDGVLSLDVKVTCGVERFATAIRARSEFRHLNDANGSGSP